jgi:hypothetical protein
MPFVYRFVQAVWKLCCSIMEINTPHFQQYMRFKWRNHMITQTFMYYKYSLHICGKLNVSYVSVVYKTTKFRCFLCKWGSQARKVIIREKNPPSKSLSWRMKFSCRQHTWPNRMTNLLRLWIKVTVGFYTWNRNFRRSTWQYREVNF